MKYRDNTTTTTTLCPCLPWWAGIHSHLSWSPTILYQLPPSTMIRGILLFNLHAWQSFCTSSLQVRFGLLGQETLRNKTVYCSHVEAECQQWSSVPDSIRLPHPTASRLWVGWIATTGLGRAVLRSTGEMEMFDLHRAANNNNNMA